MDMYRQNRKNKSFKWVISITMVLSLLCSCKLYDGNAKRMGNFSLRLDKSGNRAMVESWTWSGDLNDTLIEIPDKFEDKATIDAIGGSTGANASLQKFTILPGPDVLFRNGSGYAEDMEVPSVVFTFRIGKNIQEINVNFTEAAYAQVVTKDGSTTLYKVYIRVECSEENPVYYSENGKLYLRDRDILVTSFPYPEST